MTRPITIAAVLAVLLPLDGPASAVAADDGAGIRREPAEALRWGSTGGGWRSMWACAGFANLLSSAGLLDSLGAVSTTSGASWLSAQLFYSP